MSNPQQPELRRSEKGAPNQGSARAVVENPQPTDASGTGPIPEENLPGHHPEHEQDKPVVPKGTRPEPPPEG